MNNRIEKRIELKAPLSRVWRAVTDYHEFGEWFGVKLDGPFVPGQVSRGQITYPGYEHVKWRHLCKRWSLNSFFLPPAVTLTLWEQEEYAKGDHSKSTPPRLSNSGWRRPQLALCLCSRNLVSTISP